MLLWIIVSWKTYKVFVQLEVKKLCWGPGTISKSTLFGSILFLISLLIWHKIAEWYSKLIFKPYSIRYLGLHINPDLKWYIDTISRKAYGRWYCLFKAIKITDTHQILTNIYTFYAAYSRIWISNHMLLLTIATETYHNRLKNRTFITMISKKLIASFNGVSELQSLMLM